MTRLTGRRLLVSLLCTAPVWSQEFPSILQVEADNYVAYLNDTADPSRVARSASPVTPSVPLNFFSSVILADVTRINGAAVKGVVVIRAHSLGLNPSPAAGGAIADVQRQSVADISFEFLKADGTQIGNLYAMGFSGGVPPPGSPTGAIAGATAIMGGTGIFAGARGVIGNIETVNVRSTSQAEDPSKRRTNGGGRARFAVQVLPLVQPSVIDTGSGPQIYHADGTQVSADRPARAGEDLYLNVRGLGPTQPSVAPGDPFPAGDSPATVIAPVEVLVNDASAAASGATGAAGAIGVYRVPFRVPDSVVAGSASVQVSIAWMKGPRTQILLQ
ncbi:MAG: hypothetical protein U0Q16_00530 [Bryobacteraceae bacterium]